MGISILPVWNCYLSRWCKDFLPSINWNSYVKALIWKSKSKEVSQENQIHEPKDHLSLYILMCVGQLDGSFDKSNYFLLFIVDFSKKKKNLVDIFWKEKLEVFAAFKKFKALIEKESGRDIKVMRSKRGGEFTSNEF